MEKDYHRSKKSQRLDGILGMLKRHLLMIHNFKEVSIRSTINMKNEARNQHMYANI